MTSTGDSPDAPPDWFRYSHHDRYRKLQIVRKRWCRRHYGKSEVRADLTVRLNGAWIEDVPSFYLALGEAINGPNGYFGGDPNALADCLNGNFGVLPPLTVRLSHFEKVRAALDSRATVRFHAEHFLSIVSEGDSRDAVEHTGDLWEVVSEAAYLREMLVDNGYLGDGTEADVAKWTAVYEAALAGEWFDPGDFNPYFKVLLEVFAQGGATLVPDEDAAD